MKAVLLPLVVIFGVSTLVLGATSIAMASKASRLEAENNMLRYEMAQSRCGQSLLDKLGLAAGRAMDEALMRGIDKLED